MKQVKNGWGTTESNLRNQMMCLSFEVKVKVMLNIDIKLCNFSYVLYAYFQNVLSYFKAYYALICGSCCHKRCVQGQGRARVPLLEAIALIQVSHNNSAIFVILML